MRIDNRFTVSLPVQDAWDVLRDVGRVVPCVPGAEVHEGTAGGYRGTYVGKLGAVYEGTVRLAEVDKVDRRIVLRAEGWETESGADGSVTLTATLFPAGEGRTEVIIETDLIVSGKVAQISGDVMATLIAEFASCLEDELAPAPAMRETPAATAAAPVTVAEIIADEVADVAVGDPDRAAQFVEAVALSAPTADPLVERRPAADRSPAQRAVPAAIVGVLLMQILPKGRLKRLGLAVLGSALVAGLVAGKQQQQRR